MPNLGLEMSDAAFRVAACTNSEIRLLDIPDRHGSTEWPGFAFHEGAQFSFGRAAEDMWFVHPRRVTHTFWSKLAHEPSSSLSIAGRPPSFSELGFYFLREYVTRLTAAHGSIEKLVLAVPGAYLKDEATEEEKVGLLLGMAAELRLPLAGIVDLACAALCDPRAPGFNPTLPVVVVDVQLEGTDLTLFTAEERLERRGFLHLPNSGYAALLKQLTATMGNRFLRHTAFDILEDGRVEQTFYRQTKEFLESGAPEHRYQLNTAARNYEMTAKSEQLAADLQPFGTTLVQSLQAFCEQAGHTPGLCTIALTARTASIPALAARLRTSGFTRQLRLPAGSSAAGAARIGESRLSVPADLADVPVKYSVPLTETRRTAATSWEVRLNKMRRTDPRPAPTHAVLDGLGHSLGGTGRFAIGPAGGGSDLVLPDSFATADDCIVPLLREGGKIWFIEPVPADRADGTPAARIPVESGDRLTIRSGAAAAEVLFVHCAAESGVRA